MLNSAEVLNKLIETVDALGGHVATKVCADSAEHVLVQLDGVAAEFVMHVRERAPYPAEVASLRNVAASHRACWRVPGPLTPLLVTRYIAAPLGSRLTAAGWSWIDAVGNCDLRGAGLRVHVRTSDRPPPRPGRLPLGPANLVIIRTLLGGSATRDWTTGDIAVRTGASTVVVTQTMRKLEALALCSHSARGSWAVDSAALLDRFLGEYPGPQGAERYYYGDVDLYSVAAWLSASYRVAIAISADVGPDLVAPWRIPTTLIVYAQPTVRMPPDAGLVAVPSIGAANVVQIFPKDQSVFPRSSFLRAAAAHGDIQLADPVQMIWDLGRLGGEDRDHAAHEMRQWLNR